MKPSHSGGARPLNHHLWLPARPAWTAFRIAIGLVCGLLACLLLGRLDARAEDTAMGGPRPNVVVVLVDDMGVMDTSLPFLCDATGKPVRYPLNDFYRTPNMERLAVLGTRFSQFSAMSVCSPTRVSLMTGQNAARHHTTNWINPDSDNRGPHGPREWNWRGLRRGDVTLAALLRSAGYRTIHVGKGHFGPRGSEGADPRNLGFDINVGGASIGQPGSYYAQDGYGAIRRANAANKTGGKAANNAAGKSAGKAASKAAGKVAGTADNKADGKAANTAANKAGGTSASEAGGKTTGEAGKNGGEKAGEPSTAKAGAIAGAKPASKADAVQPTHAVPHLDAYHGGELFLTEALTIEAKRHLADAVRDGRPFFLNFAHYAVHAPFQADPRFAGNYKDSGKPQAAQAFASLVEGMDKSLGDLLSHLEKLGVAEDTLVLFLGDNGSDAPLGGPHEVACAAPLRGKKGSHYEGGMRAPLIAAWAKPNPANRWQRRTPIVANAIQRQPANITDLFPTILAAAELAIPEGHSVDGQPLQPLFANPMGTRTARPFVMHYPHAPHRSDYFTVYRDGDWKLVYHYYPGAQSGGARYELFQLGEDPFESKNLASQELDRVRMLVGDMTAMLDRLGGQYPVDPDGRTARRPMPPASDAKTADK